MTTKEFTCLTNLEEIWREDNLHLEKGYRQIFITERGRGRGQKKAGLCLTKTKLLFN